MKLTIDIPDTVYGALVRVLDARRTVATTGDERVRGSVTFQAEFPNGVTQFLEGVVAQQVEQILQRDPTPPTVLKALSDEVEVKRKAYRDAIRPVVAVDPTRRPV